LRTLSNTSKTLHFSVVFAKYAQNKPFRPNSRWNYSFFCYNSRMEIRDAKVTDVPVIHTLISNYAQLDRMLFRSHADIYENLQQFKVVIESNTPIACCALQVVWKDLAEIKSIAVDNSFAGKGIGKQLVEAHLDQASDLGLKKVFTLTLEPGFFEKIGFEIIDKGKLPMKVWSDCARCSKQDHCDETAMIYKIP